ncbi:MAG: AI-2E family transporter [Flavobacteriales bacterium]
MNKSIYDVEERKMVILVISIALGAFLLYAMRGLFSAFLGAVVLYTMFRPLFVALVERVSFKKWITALIVIALSLLIIVFPFTLITTMIFNKANDFIMNHQQDILMYFEQIRDFLGIEFTDPKIIEKGITFVQSVLLSRVTGAVNEVFSVFFTLTIMYFVLYFMIVHYKSFEQTLTRFMPFRPEVSKMFADELTNTTNANVLGQGFIAMVQGALVALAFYFFNFSDPIFWGVISMFLSFLPIVGAPIVFVPAGLIALSQGDQFGGIGMLVWGFGVVTQIDNVLRFLIAKRYANTHPLISILGVIIGFPIFGILGLVFGPLLISYFLILVKIYDKRREVSMERMEVRKIKHRRKNKPKISPAQVIPPNTVTEEGAASTPE